MMNVEPRHDRTAENMVNPLSVLNPDSVKGSLSSQIDEPYDTVPSLMVIADILVWVFHIHS